MSDPMIAALFVARVGHLAPPLPAPGGSMTHWDAIELSWQCPDCYHVGMLSHRRWEGRAPMRIIVEVIRECIDCGATYHEHDWRVADLLPEEP